MTNTEAREFLDKHSYKDEYGRDVVPKKIAYIIADYLNDKEENTIDDDLHCPKCKSTNVSCACFGENDGCNCRDCNHSFMIHD